MSVAARTSATASKAGARSAASTNSSPWAPPQAASVSVAVKPPPAAALAERVSCGVPVNSPPIRAADRVAHGRREGQVVGVDGRGRRGARPEQLVAGEDRLPAAERLKTPGRGLERERHLGREVFGGERHVEIAHLGRAGEAGGGAGADEVHGEVDIAKRHRTDVGDRPGRGGEAAPGLRASRLIGPTHTRRAAHCLLSA